MSDINLSMNSWTDNSDITSLQSFDNESPTVVVQRYWGNSIIGAPILQQSRYTYQNNQRSFTWNISLTDDQDEVSEKFLRMYNEPKTVAEKFGPAILTVPKNIRSQADELFKTSEINPNEIFDCFNTKVSWILPSSYQQYLKSIPPNVLGKRERHVLYPWTQWNTSTGTQHRPSLNRTVASQVECDRSMSSSTSGIGGGDCTLSASSISDLRFSYWAGVDATSSPQYSTTSTTSTTTINNNSRSAGHR